MKLSFLSIAALASYSNSRIVDAITCPANQYPGISSEDEYGRPYLDGPCHTSADNNDARNVVISSWVLNDATWGPDGLNAETPIVVRSTWYQQYPLSQAIAATKMGDMQSRFKKDDGSYGVPDYKLNETEIQCLYNADDYLLDRYRATIHLTAMKLWIDHSFDEELWGGPAFDGRAEFYAQLKCTGVGCRTNPIFGVFGLVNSTYLFDTDVDDTVTFANCTNKSPQSLGHTIGEELIMFADNDGWNSDPQVFGSHGPKPFDFDDPTGYYSVNPPTGGSNNKKKFNTRWQAIEETDERGYYTRQEHVTPHIGATAFTNYLSPDDREDLRKEYMMKPYTKKEYKQMAKDTLENTKSFASNETEKTIISWFDDKLNLISTTFAQIALGFRNWKLEDTSYYLQGYIMLEYDGLVVNWRSKVENDHVRPTTVVHHLLADETTDNWQRGLDGVTQYPANKWDAYIRVMPHSEHPSGSACICTAVMKWSAYALRVGYDEQFPLTYNHPMNSNRFERRLPTVAFNSMYSSHKEVADKCGRTRIDGGMHFEASVVAGDSMCGGQLVFDKGVAFQNFIWTGNQTYLEDFGGVDATGYKPSTQCKYNPNPHGKEGAADKISKFDCGGEEGTSRVGSYLRSTSKSGKPWK